MKFKKSYGELSPFAVKSRDPEFNEIDSDYSAEAIKTAEKIKKYVIAQIKKGLI